MRIGKCVLVVGVLSCVVAQSLNAMPYWSRPVSRVSSAIVSGDKGVHWLATGLSWCCNTCTTMG